MGEAESKNWNYGRRRRESVMMAASEVEQSSGRAKSRMIMKKMKLLGNGQAHDLRAAGIG